MTGTKGGRERREREGDREREREREREQQRQGDRDQRDTTAARDHREDAHMQSRTTRQC